MSNSTMEVTNEPVFDEITQGILDNLKPIEDLRGQVMSQQNAAYYLQKYLQSASISPATIANQYNIWKKAPEDTLLQFNKKEGFKATVTVDSLIAYIEDAKTNKKKNRIGAGRQPNPLGEMFHGRYKPEVIEAINSFISATFGSELVLTSVKADAKLAKEQKLAAQEVAA